MSAVDLSPLDPAHICEAVDRALREDLGGEIRIAADVTATWVLGADTGQRATARILSRQTGIVAGLDVAAHVFEQLDGESVLTRHAADGEQVTEDAVLLEIEGNARALVVAERTALNFLQRLGGIATLTRRYVDAIAGTGARITDTRKTTPGLRHLERHAVRCGGGVNHRFNLADAVLIKENHVRAAGSVVAAVAKARAGARASLAGDTRIMCEAETLDQVEALVATGEDAWPDRILLDNMTAQDMTRAVGQIRSAAGTQIEIEATGGIELADSRRVAETGVDLLSIGALTHSAPAMDLSLLFDGA